LALPALARKPLLPVELVRFAEALGSDVPFFLLGGTAVALGRGTELYPLPDLPAYHALVVSIGTHVSTPVAYQSLNRPVSPDVTNALTSTAVSPMLREFQAITWAVENSKLENLRLKNDFEDAVFKTHPELASVARKLRQQGAKPALMTGSGSALFGIFPSGAVARAAAASFAPGQATAVRFVTRAQYRRQWQRALVGKPA
jgi:4-diphosphocytidyl-2-C-methyl-D-erythritol kinase